MKTRLPPPTVFALVLSVVFIPAEQRMMLNRFGQEYRAYRKKVTPWL